MEATPYAALRPKGASCLVLVDLQNQFINRNTAHIFPGIQEILNRFTYRIVSRLVHLENGPIHRWKKWRAAPDGSDGATLALDFSTCPPDRTFFQDKTLFSAFSPEARNWLLGKGVNEVYVCGMDIDLCVLRTVFDIMESGFRPLLLADLCATFAGEPCYSNSLIQMKRLIGREQILFSQLSLELCSS